MRAIDRSGTIRTIAGTGQPGTSGDGGPASGATLSSPASLALDPASGTVYVADTGNHAIRAFAVGGTIRTVAGTLGHAGLGAEGVDALTSALRSPAGVALVGKDLVVSDTGNNRVRRLDSHGVIATAAGALDGTAGFAGDGGPAVAALLAGPLSVEPDGAGGILVADSGNNRIRRIDASGTIGTAVGSGAGDAQNVGDGDLATNAQFKEPDQLAFLPDGSIAVADGQAHRVRRMTLGGTISTIVGTGFPGFSGDGGPANRAQLHSPYAVTADRNGVIFVSDGDNSRIRAVNFSGTIQTVMGGGTGPDGVATATSMVSALSILSRHGLDELVISDLGDHTLRRLSYQVDAAGNVLNGVTDTIAGTSGSPGFSGDGGSAIAALLSSPVGTAEDPQGNLYVLDQFAAVVRKIQVGGSIQTICGHPNTCGYGGDGGPAVAAFICADYLAFDGTTGRIYLGDFTNNRVRRFQEGGLIETIAGNGDVGDSGLGGPATAALLSLAAGVLVAPDGSIIVGADGTRRLYRFTPGGTIDAVAGRPTDAPKGDGGPAVAGTIFQPLPAIAPDGTLYVAERSFGRVRRVDPATGIISTLVGKGVLGDRGFGGPASAAFIDAVSGMAVDSKGRVFMAEINQSIVSVVDPGVGTITTAVGVGPGGSTGGDGGPALQATLQFPEGVCISPTTGALYFTDSSGAVVRRVDPANAIITTVAGGGSDPSEGVPATSALLVSPSAVACDAHETLYVANRSPSSTVRRFTVGGTIVTVAGIPGNSGYDGDNVLATTTRLDNPLGLAVDPAGNIYIADSLNNRVRRVDSAGFIATVAGTGESGSGPDGVPANVSKLAGPRQLSIDSQGFIYVGEEFGNRVRRFKVFP